MMTGKNRLIKGGRVFTADPENPWAEAVVVENNRIKFVGSEDTASLKAGNNPEIINVRGGLVVPGFVDGHVHVTMTGASMLKAQLRGSGSLKEIQRRVLEWAHAHPEAPRVLGTNWVHADVPDARPSREMLDSIVPDRPVYLEAHDFHSSWVNSAALSEMGITRETPDPIGGRIVRDEITGEATGHLLESASVNFVWPLLSQVEDPVRDNQVVTALEAFARSGITSIVEMAMEEAALESLVRTQAAGKLSARVVAHMIIWRTGNPAEELALVDRAAELANRYQGDLLRVAGIKIIADGTIDGCTAALSKPYTNGTNSEPIWEAEALDPVVAAADAAGLQVAIHAIGDEAIKIAVDALENAMAVNEERERRHRIEHLEYAQDEEIRRMGELGITASMQPVHLDPTMLENWIAMIGPERANYGFAWPLYLAAGSTLAFGTDTPTAPHQPLPNMYLASTRKSPTDSSIPPLRPDWALPLEQAILHGTRESARAAWLDHITGMLKAGWAADLVVLDHDFLAQGPTALLRTQIQMSMMDGKVIYSA